MKRRLLLGVLLTVAILAAVPAAQSPGAPSLDQVPVAPGEATAQFRGKTVLIPVDVRVVDRRGQPVTDLSASDFTILEDGRPQKLEHFELRHFTPEPAVAILDKRPARAADAFEVTSPNRRTFLIVLGRGLLQEPSKGVDAMLHLALDRAMPQDYAAVLGWNRATDFTTDRAKLKVVLERFRKDHVLIERQLRLWQGGLAGLYGDGRIPDGIQSGIDAVFGGPRAAGVREMEPDAELLMGPNAALRRIGQLRLAPNGVPDPVDAYVAGQYGGTLDEFLQSAGRDLDDMTSLLLAIEYMRAIAGPKQIMFVSEYGVSWPDVHVITGIGRRASDARVAMNFIHAGGMPSYGRIAQARVPTLNPGFRLDRTIASSRDARSMSTLTGGQFFAHRFSNSAQDVDRMDHAARSQYTLGYYPDKDPVDGTYRRIQVKVARPDVTVLARDGYYARAHVGPAEMRAAIVMMRVAGAARRAFDVLDIPLTNLTATTRSGPPREIVVSMTIDLSRLSFQKRDGLNVASLDIATFAASNRQRAVGQVWHSLNLSYSDAELADRRSRGLQHESVVSLAGTPEAVKVVVYDYGADLLGSAVVRVRK